MLNEMKTDNVLLVFLMVIMLALLAVIIMFPKHANAALHLAFPAPYGASAYGAYKAASATGERALIATPKQVNGN